MGRRLVPMPPKGSIAHDRLMQAANPPPPAPEYDDEYYDDDVYDDPHRFKFKLDAGWIVIGAIAIGGLKFWPLLVVAGFAARSRWKNLSHKPYDVYDNPRAWSRVPYPYQFKWDGGWIFVTGLGAFGGLGLLLLGPTVLNVFCLFIALFTGFLRCVIWCCFRFPLTSWFFVIFTGALIGGRRRRW